MAVLDFIGVILDGIIGYDVEVIDYLFEGYVV